MPKNPKIEELRATRALDTNRYGQRARELHIAYGLLRGRPMSRIESDHSNPHLFPSESRLLDLVLEYFRPQAESESADDYTAARDAFRAQVVADLEQWRRQLRLNWLTVEAKRRQRNLQKRAARAQVA